jgi:Domain of unknown function (DUF4226)
MQVVSAILNAHLRAVDGSEALTRLQHDIEFAVQTRSDLDTPTGARDFQRFLIGKLLDIRAVVLTASLDDVSKSTLMAAWTALYDASGDDTSQPVAAEDDWDPEWDSLPDDPLLTDDPESFSDDPSGSPTPPTAAPGIPSTPMMPAVPSVGGLPSLGGPGGLPFGGLTGGGTRDPASRDSGDDDPRLDALDEDPVAGDDRAETEDASVEKPEPAPAGPTTITLPDGETVTAANPQLAAVIEAAVGGTPVGEAFQRQGITLPPPGTPVTEPIDPLQVSPADIGIFTDRYALALGPGNALVDGQIQRIDTVSGPTFLGWEHPPATTATESAPARPDAPTPTRPATTPTP